MSSVRVQGALPGARRVVESFQGGGGPPGRAHPGTHDLSLSQNWNTSSNVPTSTTSGTDAKLGGREPTDQRPTARRIVVIKNGELVRREPGR